MPPDGYKRLRDNPPTYADAFTDAVFVEEGMDPRLNRQLRKAVRERVAKLFEPEAEPDADWLARHRRSQRKP